MRELIAEHKPYIDKMNKTGPQLLELSPVAGVAIREKYTATDLLYAQLKADVKQRAFTLDEAVSKSTQVTRVHTFTIYWMYPLFIQLEIPLK
jgi:dystonin